MASTTEPYLLTVLEAENSKSRCWQVWFLLKPLSLTCRQPPSCGGLTWYFLCMPLVCLYVSTFPFFVRIPEWVKAHPKCFILTKSPLERPYISRESHSEVWELVLQHMIWGRGTVHSITVALGFLITVLEVRQGHHIS